MTVRRIGCVGDVHGALGSLRTVLEYLRTRDVEGVLLTGDFARGPLNADPALGNTASPEEILTLVTSVFSDVLLVPGNHDDPRLGGDISVDRREKSWLGWQVAGVGGSPHTGGGFPYEWSDATADFSSWPAPEILLTHSPPSGAGLDVTASGKAVGSAAIRALAERTDDDAGLRVGIRVLSREPTGDPGEIRFSLRSGHAWLESRGDEQPPFVACVAYGVEWQCHE